jgi:glycosyltransferase involved in cell wall biosynthesis
MRIAAFGFRSLPSVNGSAGADKFVEELLPRLVSRGHHVIAYNRKYHNAYVDVVSYKGVKIKTFSTISQKGFDTLLHSFKCTVDIILNDTADVVHIQNGGNSIWALPLRVFGKKVFLSQDGVDWKRGKWPWYGKIFLRISAFLSATIPNTIIFDNEIARKYFEKRFKKNFEFIPFGSEIEETDTDSSILSRYQLEAYQYFLFVGRFIPDKGLHYLVPAFLRAKTPKKLVLVGGSPNPSAYEEELKKMSSSSILYTGYLYGKDAVHLMRNAYCYIQPSDVEGLSPVILTNMGLGVPLIVSDIEENEYAVRDTALKFQKSNIESLAERISFADANPDFIRGLALEAQKRAKSEFNWDKVTDDHIRVFERYKKARG